MKRASFTLSDGYSRFPAAAPTAEEVHFGMFLLAITIATLLLGTIWFA